jgi:hypothetical protein
VSFGFPPDPNPVFPTITFEGEGQFLFGSDVSPTWEANGESFMTSNADVLFFGAIPGFPVIVADAVTTPIVEALDQTSDGRMLDPNFKPGVT